MCLNGEQYGWPSKINLGSHWGHTVVPLLSWEPGCSSSFSRDQRATKPRLKPAEPDEQANRTEESECSAGALIEEPRVSRLSDGSLETDYFESTDTIRTSELISALSYALDLTEGQPMGHSVRTCLIGMRLAQQSGLSVEEQADLYYALLLKDAGCSSNSSRLFHILNADEIRAKRDVKTTDWTRVGWESLHYALTHVATGAPFLERMQRLVPGGRDAADRIPATW